MMGPGSSSSSDAKEIIKQHEEETKEATVEPMSKKMAN